MPVKHTPTPSLHHTTTRTAAHATTDPSARGSTPRVANRTKNHTDDGSHEALLWSTRIAHVPLKTHATLKGDEAHFIPLRSSPLPLPQATDLAIHLNHKPLLDSCGDGWTARLAFKRLEPSRHHSILSNFSLAPCEPRPSPSLRHLAPLLRAPSPAHSHDTMSNSNPSSSTASSHSTPPSSLSPAASPSSPASSSMPNAAAVPATLAELLDERSGMKRKRSAPNFDGIPTSAIFEQRATVTAQREVCSPRRRSLEAAAKAQAAKEAEEAQAMDVDDGEVVGEADDDESEEESDDEEDITVIV